VIAIFVSRSFPQKGACKLQGGNSRILQSATYRKRPAYQKQSFSPFSSWH
jgi:hypothetical protein